MNDLITVQKWLTSIIIRPGKLDDKIAAADLTYGIDNNGIIKSSNITAADRIHIYARGYVLRLMECMRADFPSLQALLGTELFDTFAKAYLISLPSHSPSLFDLGKSFPEFIKASQPKVKTGADQSMFDLPVELAITERAKSEVFRSKGLEHINTQEDLNNPILGLFDISFHVSPSVRLLKLQYPLISFIRATESGQYAATPEKRDNLIVICRKNYAVGMYELETWQWYFLDALAVTDYTNAVNVAAEKSGLQKDSLFADLMIWLPVAIHLGLVWRENKN